MAARGATTIWELWNGDTADPSMNSGNHVMLLVDLLVSVLQRDLLGQLHRFLGFLRKFADIHEITSFLG